MGFIRDKIRKWLFNDMELKSLTQAAMAYHESQKELESCKKLMNEICDVGVDVGYHDTEHSWAVVCIHGKIEYVKFVPLTHKDAKSLLDFLKNFQYSKYVVDSPLGFKDMLRDRIVKNPFI